MQNARGTIVQHTVRVFGHDRSIGHLLLAGSWSVAFALSASALAAPRPPAPPPAPYSFPPMPDQASSASDTHNDDKLARYVAQYLDMHF